MSRYYSTRTRDAISNFVPAPLEFEQNYLNGLQNQQDLYDQKLESIDKTITPLSGNRDRAIQLKQSIEKQLEDAKSLNATSPNFYRDTIKTIKGVKDQFGEFGEAGAINNRSRQYQAALKDVEDDKDAEPWMKDYYRQQLLQQASDPNLDFNPQNGNYKQIKTPEKFTKVNVEDELHKVLSDIKPDTSYIQGGYSGTPIDFETAYREGKLTKLGYDKLAESVTQHFRGDLNTQKYMQGMSDHQGLGTNESQFYNIVKGEDGRPHVQFNNNTLLGNILSGAVNGAKYTDQDLNTKFVSDKLGLHNAIKQGDFDSTPHLDTGSYDPITNNPIINKATNFIDKNGNLLPSIPNPNQLAQEWGVKNGRIATGPLAGEGVVNGEKDIENKDYIEQRALINNIKEKVPNSTKGMNDAQILDYYTKTLGSNGQVSYNSFDLNGMDTDKITKHVLNNLSGKKIMVTGDPSATTLSEVGDKIGLSEDDLRKEIEKAKVNGIKPTSTNNAGSWKVTVVGGDKLPHEITIEGDKDQQRHFNEYNTLMSYDKNGTIGDVTTDNFYSHTDLQETKNPDGTYSTSYGTTIYPLSQTKLTATEAKQAEALGHKVTKTGNDYRLILDSKPIDPESFGRQLTHDWNSQGLRNYQEKENTKPTYSEE